MRVGRARVVLSMSRGLWRVVAGGSLLGLLAGCQVAATSRSTANPNPCTPQGVHQVVERFIDAFNRGDIAQLNHLVSQQPQLSGMQRMPLGSASTRKRRTGTT